MSKLSVNVNFGGVLMEFLPQKALWIKDLETLLIADLHFGKAAHFRKSGIPIPEPIHAVDLERLRLLHSRLKPRHTFFWEIFFTAFGMINGRFWTIFSANFRTLLFT